MPCCAVLCCAVLCCAVLCCAVLCCAVLCCAVLCYTVVSTWQVALVWKRKSGSSKQATKHVGHGVVGAVGRGRWQGSFSRDGCRGPCLLHPAHQAAGLEQA